MQTLMSTKEVARFLDVNEKMVYSLVAEKSLPASKVTGKWLFPRHLVEQWIENHTINYPKPSQSLPPYDGFLIMAGSNDPLLEKTIAHFNRTCSDHLAVFANLGSMGGLRALKRERCHIAASHLLQEDETDYNFAFATETFTQMPAVVNFCRREQGLLLQHGNPKGINQIGDLSRSGLRLVNRPLGTGTRLLFDRALQKEGLRGDTIDGYQREMDRHIDVGLEILAGRADAGPGIRSVAALLNLEFISLRWERYDLLIAKSRFFDKGIQLFLGLLHEPAFNEVAAALQGYDVSISGKMVFPQEPTAKAAGHPLNSPPTTT